VAGFTLVELMVTVSILAILLAIGVPSLRDFLVKQQVSADVNALNSAFRLARSEALKRSGTVSVCPLASATGTPACVTTATTDWSKGWLVFIDYANSSNVYGTFDSDRDTVLQVSQGIKSNSITSSQSDTVVSFLSNGISSSALASYTVSPSTEAFVRCITVNKQGRSYVSDGACP
jgi:type IV fimbrial biogenesis protein FimT